MKYLVFYANNDYYMSKLGNIFSRLYVFNTFIFLFGDFGVGKTFFSRSFYCDLFDCKFFLKSASFSIIESYFLNDLYFYHVDFYRLCNINDFDKTFFDKKIVLLAEWVDKMFMRTIFPDICVYIFFYSFFDRIILIKSKYIDFNKLFF